MEVYILGNGFDLHFGFPTKYANFFHVVQFIIRYYDQKADAEVSSVGQIFSDCRLWDADNDIKNAYRLYGDSYNLVSLDNTQLRKFAVKAANNMWYKYLSELLADTNSKPGQSGWIDVEKEIATAIDLIWQVLSETERYHQKVVLGQDIYFNSAKAFIINRFNFFWTSENQIESYGLNAEKKIISTPYLMEEPRGSGNLKVDKACIANKLYEELMALASLLQAYLYWFIDLPLSILVSDPRIAKNSVFMRNIENPVEVITFNYTHTWERLYNVFGNNASNVAHIHGKTIDSSNWDKENNIVLGINNDRKDEIDTLDTTFLQFKKYYQRIVFFTEIPYQHLYTSISAKATHGEKISIKVIGHSLDVTDGDIIKEIFKCSSMISIYYHNEADLAAKTKSLVNIYGKQGLDNLKNKHNLRFFPMATLSIPKQHHKPIKVRCKVPDNST